MDSHTTLCEILRDLYKDVHGVRPRHLDMSKLTESQLGAMVDSLQTELVPNPGDIQYTCRCGLDRTYSEVELEGEDCPECMTPIQDS